MNKATQFIRKHALAILVVAIALAVPVGVASAKYTSTVTATDTLEVTVDAKTYTIDKTKLRAQFDALTPASLTTPPTAIKFVKGSDSAIAGLISKTTDGVQDDSANSGKIGVFVSADGLTIYIAPMEDDGSAKPATTVNAALYAPTDSSSLLSGFRMPEEASKTEDGTEIPAVVGTAISTIDCSNLNTSKVTNMKQMFYYDGMLKNLTFGDMFDTSNVTNMSYMFSSLSGGEAGKNPGISLDLSKFNTAKLENMNSMFAASPGINKITFGDKFVTNKVTNMNTLFWDCYDLEELDLKNFDTSQIEDMSQMFAGCQTLTKLDLRSFVTSKVTTMENMFAGCYMLQTLDISSFDTKNVTNMSYLFDQDAELVTITASENFVTTGVTSADTPFRYCIKLVGGNKTKCDGTNNIDISYACIDKEGQPGYFTAAS